MSIHELAKKHFQEQRGELKSIPVPELGEGVAIYYYEWPTGEELTELLPLAAGGDYQFVLKAFSIMARDETGARIFNSVNEGQAAKDWHYPVVYRLVEEMGVAQRILDVAESAKKN